MVSLDLAFYRTLFRYAAWMYRIDPKRSLLLFLFKLFLSIQSAIHLVVFSQIVNHAVAVYELNETLHSLLLWIGVWGVTILLLRICIPFFMILNDKLMEELEDALHQQLQEKVHRLRLEAMERSDFQDILNRAKRATDPGFFSQLTTISFEFFSVAVRLVSVALIVGSWNPLLLVTIVLVTVPAPIVQWMETRIMFQLEQKHIPNSRLLHYLGGLLVSSSAVKEMRLFNMEPWFLKWWDKIYWNISNETFVQERKITIFSLLLVVLRLIGLAGSIAWSAWAVMHNGLSAGQFAGMLIALQAVQSSTSSLFGGLSFLLEYVLRIGDFFKYMDLGPEELKQASIVSEKIGDIRVEGITYRYPEANLPAIENVSFTIQSGEKVAIVGENGSGKTTLVKLLMGLYKPTMGMIYYGEYDLNQINPEQVRKKMAAVFQDFNQYAVSLQDNIGYGQFELKDHLLTVEQAAIQGGAADVAQQLAHGYDTLLTNQFSGGVELSGGQWQKVAISRAFMRNAELIALDEPTAALDPKAEAEVFHRFMDIVGVKTALLVSHRLGVTRFCDRIIVMKNGRLSEQGSHEELLTLQGEYARMWEMQSIWYKSDKVV